MVNVNYSWSYKYIFIQPAPDVEKIIKVGQSFAISNVNREMRRGATSISASLLNFGKIFVSQS